MAAIYRGRSCSVQFLVKSEFWKVILSSEIELQYMDDVLCMYNIVHDRDIRYKYNLAFDLNKFAYYSLIYVQINRKQK